MKAENTTITSQDPPPPPKKCPEFISAPVRALHEDFMKFAFELLMKKDLFWQERRNEPPIRFRTPERLSELIDFELGNNGLSQLKLLTIIRKMIFYSANIAHPYCVYQLLAGLDPYAVVGDFVASVVSTPMISYKDGPAYAMMERESLAQVRKLIGYPNGEGDGVFLPGGSLSNSYAMALARQYKFPETKEIGMLHLSPLVIFVSSQCHYSFIKGTFFEGFGTRHVVKVETDDKGKMSCVALENEIKKTLERKQIPLMVGATAGTTILGAFDPFEDIAKICQKYKLWFHVDGSFGGGVIVSQNQRFRLKGVELSDSFGWNQHKMQSSCETCSTFVTRHSDIIKETFGLGSSSPPNNSFRSPSIITFEQMERRSSLMCNDQTVNRRSSLINVEQLQRRSSLMSVNPLDRKRPSLINIEQVEQYLKMSDNDNENDDEYDSAEKHIQCSRRADVVKFWMLWKARGLEGMGQHIDHIYENAKYITEELKRRQVVDGSFIPVLEEFECTNISFYYVPPHLRNQDKDSDEYTEKLSRHTSCLMSELILKGIMLVVAQRLTKVSISTDECSMTEDNSMISESPLFFKLVLHSSGVTKEDCVYLLDQIEYYGKDLVVPPKKEE